MAYTKIASVSAGSVDSGVSVVTGSINTTGADLIVVHVADFSTATGSLTDSKGNGGAYTGLTAAVASGNVRSRLYYLFSPTVGSGHTFTYTSTSGTAFPSIQAIAFSGGLAFDQLSTNNSASGTLLKPGSLTPPSDDALFVTGFGFAAFQAGTVSVDAGFTTDQISDFNAGNAEGGALGFFIQTTAAAKDPEWALLNAAVRAASMATFTASGGGGGSRPVKMAGPWGGYAGESGGFAG